MSSSGSSSSSPSATSIKRGIKRKRDTFPASAKPKEAIKDSDSDSNDTEPSSSPSDTTTDNESGADDAAPQESEILSHAAQRKLKKKAEKEAKQIESSQSANETQDEPGALPKRLNSVWVGNLAFKTTEQALRTFFQRGVPRCKVTRVNMPSKGIRNENRGFAYVDFSTKEDKDKAIALSEQHLDGRKLLIKDGDDFTGRPLAVTKEKAVGLDSAASRGPSSTVGKNKTEQRILSAQKQPPASSLFLGNLGFQTTEQSIREMIERNTKHQQNDSTAEKSSASGKKGLKKVRMGTFEDSGNCKGFAFVDFATVEDATLALLDPHNHYLDGRKLVVEYASAEAVRRGGGSRTKIPRDRPDKPGGSEKRRGDKRQTKELSHSYAGSGENTKNQRGFAPEDADEPPSKRKKEGESGKQKDKGSKARRSKPGAALALAKREKVAIVPSSGKKIVF